MEINVKLLYIVKNLLTFSVKNLGFTIMFAWGKGLNEIKLFHL